MDTVNFGDNRWKIVYGSYNGMEKKAMDLVYETVSKYLPYILVSEQQPTSLEDNIIFVGTRESNPYIRDLITEDAIPADGYTVRVTDSTFQEDKQMIIIAGTDDRNVFYGSVDFSDDYIANAKPGKDHQPYFRKLFSDKMPTYEKVSSPDVKTRGLWTWGHTIYDYEKYLNNMARLKLNQLIVWNDYVPINAKDLVDYAHSNGIQVIWGYSWGWGTQINISDPNGLKKWADIALQTYEENYSHLGGDGIYFQSFTETSEDTKDGLLIAEVVTNWVNIIGGKLLEKYSGLHIQFGLHATSVKEQLNYIRQIDKRISIIWEDCGAFPYQYIPRNIEDFEGTQEFTQKMIDLRGDAPFGAVLKGQICLDWSNFEHQKGSFVLGKASKSFIKSRTEEKNEIWHYVQSYWLKNGGYCQDIIRQLADETNGTVILAALVEDGLFEENIWLPVALYAQMLWNCHQPFQDLLCQVSQRENVVFA